MISLKKLTKVQAKEFVDSIDLLPDEAFDLQVSQWKMHFVTDYSLEYEELRNLVLSTYTAYSDRKEYEIDYNVGICLYEYLNPQKGFTTVMANDDDIWRYISCKVFPDLTYARYPQPAKDDIRINKKRFYSHTRRIWLKTLWWYVHLSWQGDAEHTKEILKQFGSDTIGQLIERTGQGYRLTLYRQLMKSYAGVRNKQSNTFKSIQKYNLINCRTVEPSLVQGAEQRFVKDLFDQLSIEVSDDN